MLGDGEYTIFMVLGWRNKAFGDASEFVWGRGKGQYAVRERSTDPKIKIYNDFKEAFIIRPDFVPEGIHGMCMSQICSVTNLGDGPLLAVRGKETIAFYDWEKGLFISQIDGIEAKDLYWSLNGTQVRVETIISNLFIDYYFYRIVFL